MLMTFFSIIGILFCLGMGARGGYFLFCLALYKLGFSK